MPRDASELARRLAQEAEAVCRHFLSNGERHGRYWVVGDSRNTPGRSLFVRLNDLPLRPAGKWTDAATGEHGDLLDIIRTSCGLVRFRDVADEARRFLSMPRPSPRRASIPDRPRAQSRSVEAARRLFAMSQPIGWTVAQAYLWQRGIRSVHDDGALRFHAHCYYRPSEDSPTEAWPALIASVTDLDGRITGIHRTWLHPSGHDKAPVHTPRRAMGGLLGNGVRFGAVDDVLVAGEGIETMLSLRCVLPTMPMIAALSASHLAALLLPLSLRRLYIASDADAAGMASAGILTTRAEAAGIEVLILSPWLDDFNSDLRTLGIQEFETASRAQFLAQDFARFALWRRPIQDSDGECGRDIIDVLALRSPVGRSRRLAL
ncbi:toprim domain-containing protein [Bradyrhizobium jicamae]|uniref:Toprim domain-containing protein n=1 Tax=Bradyrhizobium jicamae TaxID=280332 RepID=A0ABS5FRJ6_9BRAD|nr:toprim domain-containing protein [Bradyrhizobium jicamae]MBR0799407.1 toprim domain-containing protein [Bradyrhizobium jicamae]